MKPDGKETDEKIVFYWYIFYLKFISKFVVSVDLGDRDQRDAKLLRATL